VPVPVPVEQVARETVRSESIGEKIAEIELRLRKDRRNEIVEKILQKNAVKQQKHLRFVEWLASLKHYIELLRSFGKTVLHKTHTTFSTIYAMKSLNKARKIRL
ncbi:relaxase, partial [Cronobacter sakazakii]|nr:relaxase [Cronobacter sakazakii]